MPKAAPYTASNGFAVSIDQHTLLASPIARGLVASVLAVVEREADAGWLQRGCSSLGGGTVVPFSRIWMASGECRLKGSKS